MGSLFDTKIEAEWATKYDKKQFYQGWLERHVVKSSASAKQMPSDTVLRQLSSFIKAWGSEENVAAQLKDFFAVAWQHEMDHLEGHLFIEKLSLMKRKKFEKEWKKRLKEQKK